MSISGEPIIDEIFRVLLSTSMFIGGGVAFFLDNTIPGQYFSAVVKLRCETACETISVKVSTFIL